MKNCDTCPGNTDCAGTNLHPVLTQVLDLYGAGTTDKFDILFALGEDSENLLERYTYCVSPDCWTKAALLAIAGSIVRAGPGRTEQILGMAIEAFGRFPWQIGALIEQAPDLYQAIIDNSPDDDFANGMSRRAFVKICKTIVYG